jgi:hypothetical protein
LAYQPPVLFYQNKPATNNQPTVLFSHNKSANSTFFSQQISTSHQPSDKRRVITAQTRSSTAQTPSSTNCARDLTG